MSYKYIVLEEAGDITVMSYKDIVLEAANDISKSCHTKYVLEAANDITVMSYKDSDILFKIVIQRYCLRSNQ